MNTLTDPDLNAFFTEHLGHDGLQRLLGGSIAYLPDSLRGCAPQRLNNIVGIFSVARQRLGRQLDQIGQVAPRVLHAVVLGGSYCSDPLAQAYLGGVLASARTESGRDDRGARMLRLIDGLSIYQLRTHYLLYASVRELFREAPPRLDTPDDRALLQVFLPHAGFMPAMELRAEELRQPQLFAQVFQGLRGDGLIEGPWRIGRQESLRKLYPDAPEAGIVCQPSPLGVELFLWAFGAGGQLPEQLFDEGLDTEIAGVRAGVNGARPTRPGTPATTVEVTS